MLEELKRLDAAATKGPWWYDGVKNDGEYGSGEDIHAGFDSFNMLDDCGQVLFDSLNSTAAVVEDYDSEGSAQDAVAHNNFRLIEFLRNHAADFIALLEREAKVRELASSKNIAEFCDAAKMLMEAPYPDTSAAVAAIADDLASLCPQKKESRSK